MLNDKNHRQHSYAAIGIGLPLDAAYGVAFLYSGLCRQRFPKI